MWDKMSQSVAKCCILMWRSIVAFCCNDPDFACYPGKAECATLLHFATLRVFRPPFDRRHAYVDRWMLLRPQLDGGCGDGGGDGGGCASGGVSGGCGIVWQ